MTLDYGFDVTSVIEDGRTTQLAVDQLKEWLSRQNFPDLTDQQLALFLLSCDNDPKATQTTIREHYKAKSDGPEIFNNRDAHGEDVQKQLRTLFYAVFPQRTADGSVIVYHKLRDTHYLNYNQPQAIKALFMGLEVALHGKPPTGLVMLFDMSGVGIMHLTRIRIGALRKMLHFVQEGIPLKLKRIHVLNTQYFIDKIMAILKPFLKKEVLDLLVFHPPTMDMEEFYRDHIAQECLPKEYGGELQPLEVLHDETVKKMVELKPFFDAEEEQRS